ncbi:MAG: Ig-like domain-containing protein [Chloroflexi bacterium]|nr:Ig-like domain-containing protein [Chloroflexota bacterium]
MIVWAVGFLGALALVCAAVSGGGVFRQPVAAASSYCMSTGYTVDEQADGTFSATVFFFVNDCAFPPQPAPGVVIDVTTDFGTLAASSVTTDANGKAQVTLRLPGVPPGGIAHVTGTIRGTTVSQTTNVATAVVWWSNRYPHPGQTITFQGSGFFPNEALTTFTYGHWDATAKREVIDGVIAPPYAVTTDARGRFQVNWTVPLTQAIGVYDIYVAGANGDGFGACCVEVSNATLTATRRRPAPAKRSG